MKPDAAMNWALVLTLWGFAVAVWIIVGALLTEYLDEWRRRRWPRHLR